MRRIIGGAIAAGVAVFAGVGAMGDDTTRDDSGDIVESGGLGVYSFQIGDCIQFPVTDEQLVESVEGVPCSEPHDAQVYVEFDLAPGAFPGDDAIFEAAAARCYAEFDAAIGIPYDSTPDLDFTAFTPVEEGWEAGDREVTCFVVRTDYEKWTGTALAADRG